MAVLLLPVLLAVAVVLLVAAVRPQPAVVVPEGSRLASVRQRTSRWRWGGIASGVVLAVVALQVPDTLGRGTMLAAPMFAFGVLAGVLGGELRVVAPPRSGRSASLEVRRVRDYLPPRLSVAVGVGVIALGLLLALTTAVGSPDDLGRAGRRLVQVCVATAEVTRTVGRGPWPGSFYSVPLATVVLAGLAASAAALQQIVRRPRQGEDAEVDDVLRTDAAAAVVAASGILIAVPLAGVSAIASMGLLGIDCPSWWMRGVGWLTLLAVPLAAALVAWCAAALVMPRRIGARHGTG
ncbi:MAG: hypothetical protein JJT89_01435 [Nitriliruptoraceae bacterium]|nr:hypothetical protein [Nitriliruptoraceae bacterium]